MRLSDHRPLVPGGPWATAWWAFSETLDEIPRVFSQEMFDSASFWLQSIRLWLISSLLFLHLRPLPQWVIWQGLLPNVKEEKEFSLYSSRVLDWDTSVVKDISRRKPIFNNVYNSCVYGRYPEKVTLWNGHHLTHHPQLKTKDVGGRVRGGKGQLWEVSNERHSEQGQDCDVDITLSSPLIKSFWRFRIAFPSW